jgi:hypothetical protein
MPDVAPPVPDPRLKPTPADDMAEAGCREGPGLTDRTRPDETDIEADPQFAQNGD